MEELPQPFSSEILLKNWGPGWGALSSSSSLGCVNTSSLTTRLKWTQTKSCITPDVILFFFHHGRYPQHMHTHTHTHRHTQTHTQTHTDAHTDTHTLFLVLFCTLLSPW